MSRTRPRDVIALALLMGATLTACGGAGDGQSGGAVGTSPAGLCGWFAHQPNKQGDCPPLVTAVPVYDIGRCEQAISSSCDEADRQQIAGFIACYTALPPCERYQELKFSSRQTVCNFQHPVTSACATALRSAEPK